MKTINQKFEVKNLNLWYSHGKKHTLKDITLKIPSGHVTALIGPSGCGKSTFLRCFNKMNNLVEGVIIQGSIIFDQKHEIVEEKNKKIFGMFSIKNNDISSLELRTRVGMIFQKPNPFPMSIYENVAYGPKSSGIKNKKELDQIVENCLKDAALWKEVQHNLQESALTLSGGQQQRLCIARSLAMDPEVLLMDEPTASLDPISTSKVEKLISKLKNKYTIIIVTHSMQQAARISDHTAFLYMGKLIEFNTTKNIFQKPQNEITSNYINGKMG